MDHLFRKSRSLKYFEKRTNYDVGNNNSLQDYSKSDYNDVASDLIDLDEGSYYLVKHEAEESHEDESVQDASINLDSLPSTKHQESPPSNIPKKRKIGQLYRECLLLMKKREQSEKDWREQQQELEREKLVIKRKKLELEEQKFKLEREERLTKLQMEKEDRKHRMEVERTQNNFCEKLIHILESKLL